MNFEGVICPECGKEFFPFPEHAYKFGGMRLCSWSCLNSRRKKAKSGRRGIKRVEQYTLDGELVRVFDSVNQAAEYMGCCPETIREVCRGKQKAALKFIWKYKSDTPNESE